jgi:hypothetical protein
MFHRRKGHVKVYIDRCRALGIEPNPRATQKVASEQSGLLQSSLDSIVTREPKRPPFTTHGLVDYIVQLVVCEDEVRLSAPTSLVPDLTLSRLSD